MKKTGLTVSVPGRPAPACPGLQGVLEAHARVLLHDLGQSCSFLDLSLLVRICGADVPNI